MRKSFHVFALNRERSHSLSLLKETVPHFEELSSSEKLLLMKELWDDVVLHPSDMPVPEWQKRELERRYEEYLHP